MIFTRAIAYKIFCSRVQQQKLERDKRIERAFGARDSLYVRHKEWRRQKYLSRRLVLSQESSLQAQRALAALDSLSAGRKCCLKSRFYAIRHTNSPRHQLISCYCSFQSCFSLQYDRSAYMIEHLSGLCEAVVKVCANKKLECYGLPKTYSTCVSVKPDDA